jgi:hypothetical protein
MKAALIAFALGINTSAFAGSVLYTDLGGGLSSFSGTDANGEPVNGTSLDLGGVFQVRHGPTAEATPTTAQALIWAAVFRPSTATDGAVKMKVEPDEPLLDAVKAVAVSSPANPTKRLPFVYLDKVR